MNFKKLILKASVLIFLILVAYFSFIYFVPYSKGYRAGELTKISKKGLIFKTVEGELSQGISNSQIFKFSVEDGKPEVIEQLQNLQGKYAKLTYIERYSSMFFWGDTKYFIVGVKEEQSPRK
jgi:hypothetical protein